MACVNHPAVTTGLVRCTRCFQQFCPSCYVRIRGQAYCARCKRDTVRDIQSGTDAAIELATLSRRFGALWVDSILFAILGFGAVFAGAALLRGGAEASEATLGRLEFLVLGLSAVLWFFYEGAMLQWRGQTLGKIAAGIRVVTADGGDLSTGQAWARALIRQVFFSYLALINYLPATFTKQRTCIHDLLVKTRVARVRR
jgi:uncharacterized RDD family membrane protein YckC